MKQKLAKTALVLSLCGCLLAGCTGQTNTEVEPTAAPSQTEMPAATPPPIETPVATAEPEQCQLSEEEEWELLSQFWKQARIDHLVNTPCGEDFSQYQEYYWMISSIYLKNKAEAAGEEPPRDEVYGLAYFPIDDYVYTLEAMFGEGQDYRSILPEQSGPEEDTLLVLDGYSLGYVSADLEPDSFSLQDNIISVDALRLWREGGYTKELGIVHYEIQVQPENPYCRYRFLSITGDVLPY